MTGLAELVQAPTDWYGIFPDSMRRRIAEEVRLRDEDEVLRWALSIVVVTEDESLGPVVPASARESRVYAEALLNELHDLLCSNDKYKKERRRLGREYKAGQSTLVAGTALAISPHLGAGGPFLTVAVPVVLTTIGQVGLAAWCAAQTVRRQKTVTKATGQ